MSPSGQAFPENGAKILSEFLDGGPGQQVLSARCLLPDIVKDS
jgi:hypothetical protein